MIEDITNTLVERWKDRVENAYSKQFSTLAFALVIMPNQWNSFDNNLLVVSRSAK